MSFTTTSFDTPDGADEEGTSVKASRYDALIGERSKGYVCQPVGFERLPVCHGIVSFCFASEKLESQSLCDVIGTDTCCTGPAPG